MSIAHSPKANTPANPTVSVLMPAYNAAPFIREAIESILHQTYTDFEFIIIDDGSKDGTAAIVQSYRDKRIRLVHNRLNLGIVRTLNKGIALAKGKYLARMDSDDISEPDRLALQVEFMNQNPSVAVVGGAIQEFSHDGLGKMHRMPLSAEEIRTRLLFGCVLMHPTVMMRLKTMRLGNYAYSPKHTHVEDFGLWQAIAFRHDLANLPNVLLKYRISEGSITQQAEKRLIERDNAHIVIYNEALHRLKIKADHESLIALRFLITQRKEISCDHIHRAENLLSALRKKLDPNRYNLAVFDDMVARRFLAILRTAVLTKDSQRIAEAIQASMTFRKYSLWTIPGIAQQIRIPLIYSILRCLMKMGRVGKVYKS